MEAIDINRDTDENERDDFEYFKRNKPEVFILLSGFSEKTTISQILQFLNTGFSFSPVDDGVYGVLFLTTAEGFSTGKAVVRLKSIEFIDDILKKHGHPLNKRPITIKPISKTEGLALLYNIKNK